MPGTLLSPRSPGPGTRPDKMAAARSDLFLIVSPFHQCLACTGELTVHKKSNEDVVYEQDILRDPGSIKPWLSYIEFKAQHGTPQDQAFVSVCPLLLLILV